MQALNYVALLTPSKPLGNVEQQKQDLPLNISISNKNKR